MITLKQKGTFCYIDADSFTVYIKTEDIYISIAKDVETRFDTSNYELHRPLHRAKNKKGIGLMKDDLDGKIMTEFVALRPKAYSGVLNNGDKNEKAKCTKKRVIKCEFKF